MATAPKIIGQHGLRAVDDDRPRVVDAFNSALRASSRKGASRKDWRKAVERFLVWLSRNHPRAEFWDLVSRDILREYLRGMEGKAAHTRRLAVQPIIQTSKHMVREWGARNDLSGLSPGSQLAKPPPVVLLRDVIDWLEWQLEHRPGCEVGSALCGLAGFRVMEAIRLRWEQVDLDRGLVTVVEGKNRYSNRTIPVASRVMEALRRARAWQDRRCEGVVDMYGHVVLDGNWRAYRTSHAYYVRFVRGLAKWGGDVGWAAKDLRNCLPQLGETEGFWGPICEQYFGHAPRGVTATHYLPPLSARGDDGAMDVFRRNVVDHVDRGVADVMTWRAQAQARDAL